MKQYFYRYAEAEAALLQKTTNDSDSLDNVTTEYGDQASFALSLLGNIAAKTERKPRAIDAWRRALKLNPFQWSSFENLCKIGDKPNPQNLFQISGVENLSMCQGSNINNIESVIITNSTPNQDNQEAYITTPQQILVNLNPSLNTNSKICTPDESPLCSQSVWLSGFVPISSRMKSMRLRMDSTNNVSTTM
jgi:anaphase-promoting complex subunit 3